MATFSMPPISPRRIQQLELDVARLNAEVVTLKRLVGVLEQGKAKGRRQDQTAQAQLDSLAVTVNHLASHMGMVGE